MHGIKSTFKTKNITQSKTTNNNPYKSYKVGPEPSYKSGPITPLKNIVAHLVNDKFPQQFLSIFIDAYPFPAFKAPATEKSLRDTLPQRRKWGNWGYIHEIYLIDDSLQLVNGYKLG